jgi:hypothetical protein
MLAVLVLSQPFLFAFHVQQHRDSTHPHSTTSAYSYQVEDEGLCQLCADYFHQIGDHVSIFSFCALQYFVSRQPIPQAPEALSVIFDLSVRGPPHLTFSGR